MQTADCTVSGTLKKSLTSKVLPWDLRLNLEEEAPRTARLPGTELRRGLSATREQSNKPTKRPTPNTSARHNRWQTRDCAGF